MAVVIHASDVGEQLREPRTLPRRRVRLSAVIKQEERIKGRPFIVSVHRKGNPLAPADTTVRTRAQWKTTSVGPNDVVVITYLPLGGGGGRGGGGGKQIGMALAMLVLSVVAPMIVGALGPAFAVGGSLTMLGKVVTMGLIAGVGYFLSKANKPKANQEDNRPVYGVSGGGNVPRPGDRIPVHYGKFWFNPDLSQPDYFRYEGTPDGDSVQILYKRMTLGLGEYDIHQIRVGAAVIWDEGTIKEPFTGAVVEIIEPNKRSTLVPSGVYSSDLVSGTEMVRSDETPAWSGPFPVVPPGETTKAIQVDWSLPQGLYAVLGGKPGNRAHAYSVVFQYATIDEDGNIVGAWKSLYAESKILQTTRAQRFTQVIPVPEGRYAVRAQTGPKNRAVEAGGGQTYDMVMWDGLRGHLDKEPLRPHVTEIAMKITSGKATGNVSSFSDIWVQATRKVPTWNGSTWTAPIATRKAVWAALDIIRHKGYGYGAPDGKIDLQTFLHYAGTLATNDTFDGTIRGPVAVLEALNTVLGVIRSEPVVIGDVWSMARDEARTLRKHVITRRQIVKDTSGAEFDLDLTGGESDVIVEYYVDGDPRRRNEQRVTIGPETLTPRRIQMFGVTNHAHATMLARWYAAVAYYRREQRTLTTEMAGRNLERNQPALIDTWFLDDGKVAGVESRSGYSVTLDADVPLPANAHAVFRNEQGLEWGPVAITGKSGRTISLLSSDVSVIESFSGQSMASIFSRAARKLPMTVLIGTLATLQNPYIIRSARPDGTGNVQVSAVYDSPQVWSVLGEAPPPAPPIREVILDEGDLMPILPWVRATVVQKATALAVDWAVGEARGAVGYRVDIRYGDGSESPWEVIHTGAGSSGSHVIEFRENVELRVRARAYNRKNVVSPWIYTQAAMFKPTLTGEVASMLIELEMLQAQVRRDIENITKIGEETIRGALRSLEERVNELAAAAATEAGTSYERGELIKISLGDAFAAVKEETEMRVSGDEALVTRIDTQAVRIGDNEAAISSERTSRVDADNALSSRIDTVQAGVGPGTEAAIAQERTARIDGDNVLANDISVVRTTTNGHSATITQNTASINGVRAEHGVAIEIDGQAVGGYRLTGFRKLDGSFVSQFGIRGDLVVDGTIWGSKLAASNVITASAQIGNAVITNAHIQNAAITAAKIGTAEIDELKLKNGSVTSSVTIAGAASTSYAANGRGLERQVWCRAGGQCVAIISFIRHTGTITQSGQGFELLVDGVSQGNFIPYIEAEGGAYRYHPLTFQVTVNNPSTGYRTFLLRSLVNTDPMTCRMTILEMAR